MPRPSRYPWCGMWPTPLTRLLASLANSHHRHRYPLLHCVHFHHRHCSSHHVRSAHAPRAEPADFSNLYLTSSFATSRFFEPPSLPRSTYHWRSQLGHLTPPHVQPRPRDAGHPPLAHIPRPCNPPLQVGLRRQQGLLLVHSRSGDALCLGSPFSHNGVRATV